MTTAVSPEGQAEAVREIIERRAYEKYLARGAVDGFDVEDWLEAEAETLTNQPASPVDGPRDERVQSPDGN